MKKILNKLKSNNGSTLIIALLFFAVCAVTGSMILVSASAASGRLKGMQKQDQNYYAVSSAVRFLEKTLCDDIHITAKETLEITTETETETNENGEEEEVEVTTYDYEPPQLYFSGAQTLASGLLFDLLTDAEITNYSEKCSANDERDPEEYPSEFNYGWFKEDSIADFNGAFPEGDSDRIKKTTLSVNSGSDEIEPLKIDVLMYLDETGTLLVKCKNHIEESDETENEDNGNSYSVILRMEYGKTVETKETGSEGHRIKTREYDFKLNTVSVEKSKK